MATFNEYRPLLFSIAYRMLGSVMDAEDMVQETFLRWRQVEEDEVRKPKSYLASIVTRLCIDHLRSARVQRETYLGPWLPEPLVADQSRGVAESVALADSLSMAFLVLLESLAPTERAVFLLRVIFDYEYAEIAEIVDKSEVNCRQIVSRARRRIQAERPRFDAPPERQRQLTAQFAEACATGNLDGLLEVLTEDIILWADGGEKVAAARRPIRGADRVARYLLGVIRFLPQETEVRITTVNGQPGIIAYVDGQPYSVVVLGLGAAGIKELRIVVNPDKLSGVPPLSS